jgi:hypothetical protein
VKRHQFQRSSGGGFHSWAIFAFSLQGEGKDTTAGVGFVVSQVPKAEPGLPDILMTDRPNPVFNGLFGAWAAR